MPITSASDRSITFDNTGYLFGEHQSIPGIPRGVGLPEYLSNMTFHDKTLNCFAVPPPVEEPSDTSADGETEWKGKLSIGCQPPAELSPGTKKHGPSVEAANDIPPPLAFPFFRRPSTDKDRRPSST
mmetsp:Transcript_82756/g.96749  ORF Transcript_82756/g.96749 Transcript_82756/m.96749 type:complete len:127 (+) Transcript_82756:635-1015(+)